MPYPSILTMSDAFALSEIFRMAQTNAPVRWLSGDDPMSGQVRAITSADGTFYPRDADIRGAYLWITTSGGFETFKPLSDIIPMIADHTFVEQAV